MAPAFPAGRPPRSVPQRPTPGASAAVIYSRNPGRKVDVKLLAVLPVASLLAGCSGLVFLDPVRSEGQIEAGLRDLEQAVVERMRGDSLEAVSVAIVTRGRLAYSKAFGVEPEGRFQAASISKVVSAYAALKLVEEGRLSLDAPLSGCLPVAAYFPPASPGDRITLRMVLNHSSGLSNDALGHDRAVHHEPGEGFHYSGGGFAFLTRVVEKVTGQPFDTFMEREILVPLGMGHSRFRIDELGVLGVSAAYSLVTTPADLATFFIELMDPRHLDPARVRAMLSDSVVVNDRYSWGLGVGLQHGGPEDAIWHWGNNDDFHRALAVFYPKTGTGVVVMTRGRGGSRTLAWIAHQAIGGAQFGLDFAIPMD